MLTTEQVKYLATTDFELVLLSLEAQLTPRQFRVLQYHNCCKAHDIQRFDLTEVADWLSLEVYDLYCDLKVLEEKRLIDRLNFESK